MRQKVQVYGGATNTVQYRRYLPTYSTSSCRYMYRYNWRLYKQANTWTCNH